MKIVMAGPLVPGLDPGINPAISLSGADARVVPGSKVRARLTRTLAQRGDDDVRHR